MQKCRLLRMWVLSQMQTWQEEKFFFFNTSWEVEKRVPENLVQTKNTLACSYLWWSRMLRLFRKEPISCSSLPFSIGKGGCKTWQPLFSPIHSHRHHLYKPQKLHKEGPVWNLNTCPPSQQAYSVPTHRFSLFSLDGFFYSFWEGEKGAKRLCAQVF